MKIGRDSVRLFCYLNKFVNVALLWDNSVNISRLIVSYISTFVFWSYVYLRCNDSLELSFRSNYLLELVNNKTSPQWSCLFSLFENNIQRPPVLFDFVQDWIQLWHLDFCTSPVWVYKRIFTSLVYKCCDWTNFVLWLVCNQPRTQHLCFTYSYTDNKQIIWRSCGQR